ncbi:hypothetical protein HNP84_004527 [Thermocatellispora tengchongensis]|uniref:Uncharacterized protein n=1 Tax=Thermocatellispora tengchongensis TaxID=1073253 RepID=A0A840PA42_9ACTN|nr:hypothetical protein [Thermocatellispora tengchongensis]MBB5134793.1 hypothetical protein [Thermocatellispora tengchongensis]
MRATWPEWIIRSGPMWWACLRAPLTPRERAAGLRPLIGRVSGAELAMELNAEDRAARRLAYASR